ncbi:hypothetical protein HDU98_008994 [Podochytrium sp. JEL0797]|nr:hypothetical protein HDU98_008994 [Podochytrium sp. JEL0797]
MPEKYLAAYIEMRRTKEVQLIKWDRDVLYWQNPNVVPGVAEQELFPDVDVSGMTGIDELIAATAAYDEAREDEDDDDDNREDEDEDAFLPVCYPSTTFWKLLLLSSKNHRLLLQQERVA